MSRDRRLQLCINQKNEFSHAKAMISRPKQGKDEVSHCVDHSLDQTQQLLTKLGQISQQRRYYK